MHTYIHAYIHTYMHAYMQTYMHDACMHTYMHIHICYYVNLVLTTLPLGPYHALWPLRSYYVNFEHVQNLTTSLPFLQTFNTTLLPRFYYAHPVPTGLIRHPHLLSLGKDVKLGFHTVPMGIEAKPARVSPLHSRCVTQATLGHLAFTT